jgi:hypothetical protein
VDLFTGGAQVRNPGVDRETDRRILGVWRLAMLSNPE